MAATLLMWVIYERPADFPDHLVARIHIVDHHGSRPTAEAIKVTLGDPEDIDNFIDRLEVMRQSIRNHPRPELRRQDWLDRSPEDEAQIVGVML